ncbi:UvrD-helicase domain-containing protein [Paraherbaspirillum soli]|uniref:UvrD-helicase domain-containing protein n=1 Tax=Paraherbaspirillum soli TaxID=631222 RepID=A0ABW0MC27_9BURK
MANHLTLAVAGGRKTQMIAERCAQFSQKRRVAVLTYTQTNQNELKIRLAKYASGHVNIEVMGWFTFLLHHFAKPFLPLKFSGLPVPGFNFEGEPDQYATGAERFLDGGGRAYRCELPRLTHELISASKGAAIRRLECLYDEILIDEVQDFCGYDLDLLEALFTSSIHVWMVGDVRQAILSTNAKAKKNKQYRGVKILDWFRKQEQGSNLSIDEVNVTWRCRQEIADFSDGLFDSSYGFSKTESKNDVLTNHDGVFFVKPQDVPAYVREFNPQCLRDSIRSAKKYNQNFINFGAAKGSTHERVLVFPTGRMESFITKKAELPETSIGDLYVAVTRATQSAAIVLEDPGCSSISFWKP